MTAKYRRRTRLRRKEVGRHFARLTADFGMEMPSDETHVDEADAGDARLLLIGSEAIALFLHDDVVPTVRGLLAYPARRRYVTVDMGAVPHVYNGADVMAPGIIDADAAIQIGDIVWIRDERNLRPLGVGRAIMDGPSMARERKGKAIETLHHVGDRFWSIGEEPA